MTISRFEDATLTLSTRATLTLEDGTQIAGALVAVDLSEREVTVYFPPGGDVCGRCFGFGKVMGWVGEGEDRRREQVPCRLCATKEAQRS